MKLFKVCWNSIKDDLLEGLTHLYLGWNMVRQLNHKFITLLPKGSSAESMDHFRLISCANSLYKIHLKITIDQLAEMVPRLISRNEATFVKERQIDEQFKIAREMSRRFGQKSTPRRFCMRVDLRKAFDTLSWTANDTTLSGMGFLEDFRHILD